MSGFTYIPDGLMTQLGLSLTEAFFFSKTFSFCKNYGGTSEHYVTYKGLEEQFGISRSTIIRTYRSLCEKGLLTKKNRGGGTTFKLTKYGFEAFLKADAADSQECQIDTMECQNDTMKCQNDTSAKCQNDTMECQNDTMECQNDTMECQIDTHKILSKYYLSNINNIRGDAREGAREDAPPKKSDQEIILEGIVAHYEKHGMSYVPDFATVTTAALSLPPKLRAIYGDECVLSDVWPKWLEKAWRNSDAFMRKKFDLDYISKHFNEYQNGKRNDRPEHLDYRPTTGRAESTIEVNAREQAIAESIFAELGMEST